MFVPSMMLVVCVIHCISYTSFYMYTLKTGNKHIAVLKDSERLICVNGTDKLGRIVEWQK